MLVADLIAERCFFEVARAKKRDVAISPEACPSGFSVMRKNCLESMEREYIGHLLTRNWSRRTKQG